MALASALAINKIDSSGMVLMPRRMVSDNDMELIPARFLNNFSGCEHGLLGYFFAKFAKKRNSYRLSEKSIQSGGTILYCCGYIFGDRWGISRLKKVLEDIKKAKKNGCKVVLMPQSFGPFGREENRLVFRELLDLVDLGFARDDESFFYASPFDQKGVIANSIDYTGLLNEIEVLRPENKCNRLCVVPNNKILEKYGASAEKEYVNAVVRLAQHIKDDIKCKVAILRHTIGKDDYLIKNIHDRLPGSDVVQFESFLAARKYIGESSAVISSRFHGMMHSLTQGVPVIALGWSHKYQGAMEKYSLPDYCVDFREGGFESLASDFIKEMPKIASTLRERQAFLERAYYSHIFTCLEGVVRR